MLDELGHHVDAGRVDMQRAEVRGEVTRPAAHVEHHAGPDRQVPGDQGQVVRVHLGAVAQQLDVPLCHDSVGPSNLFHGRAI